MGHWYTKDGEPCHFQEDGKDTTLRHARKQNLVPSVTGILDVVDKPGLTNYFLKQQLEAAWDSDGVEGWSDKDEWAKAVKAEAKKHSEQARDRGLAIHDAIELFYNDKAHDPQYDFHVNEVCFALKEKYPNADWEPERTFSYEDFGGMVDLSCPEVIIDYKYKTDGFTDKTKLVYDTHFGQLAAYKLGLGYPDAVCANVFISDDKVKIIEHSAEDMARGLTYFLQCLDLWKTIKRFNP